MSLSSEDVFEKKKKSIFNQIWEVPREDNKQTYMLCKLFFFFNVMSLYYYPK